MQYRQLVKKVAEFCDQTKMNDKVVIPVHDTIFELAKTDKCWERIPHPGFIFAPLL